jgi:predicted O-linked N-acetylglucosamine transferase (SPINDLY family)
MRQLPNSRLVLKYQGWSSPDSMRNWRQLFEAEGLRADRVEFLGHSSLGQYFNEYNKIDVTLDPFPHNGGLTTCDSLWMGVPVVTCPGETFAGRQGLSHLSTVGLTETIASDQEEYVDIAVRLAGDLPRLAEIRARLRSQMAASPLCDGKRFAENLMQLLRGVWQEWCRSSSSRPERRLDVERSLEPGSPKA